MGVTSTGKTYLLEYPVHRFKPLEVADFIEMRGFSQDWQRLGLNDDDLAALQIAIMAEPTRFPVVKGTGGLRKIRGYGGPSRKKPFRVCFVYFSECSLVLLVVAYAKNEKDDLSDDDRKTIRAMIVREREVLSRKAIS